ncbi:MAG: DUF1553 domain-containing protein [Planctomycetaceae bacterium]
MSDRIDMNLLRVRRWFRSVLFPMFLMSGGCVALAADPPQYNRDIRPILAEHCFACHGADSASRKGDLRLDQREAAIDAGAISAGRPDDSELISRIFTDDAETLMPPPETKKPLTAAQKERLKRWIADGAEYQQHWSFLAPQKSQPPQVMDVDWVRNDIDRFVLANLERHGLTPAPEADARTLFRRLHLDITGLPPKPGDVEAFVTDYNARRDAALSEWIDRLMASSAWGEHRARYWLDAARYADTHGLHFDNYREIWPYRDWVIRAFNANLPFDRFSIEQIAGDLLPNPTDDQLIATGFQRCNMTTNEGGTIDEENVAVYAADRVQTLGWVYLGLTTNCGQCHDHKFDPFTMKDYYSLAAFFRNTTQPAKDGNVKDGRSSVLMVPSEQDKPRWDALPDAIAAATKLRDERRASARPDFETWLASATPAALDADVPSDHMLVHALLTEGSGNAATDSCEPPTTFQATGPVMWIPDGKLGPAPIMKPGSTFDLGNRADFEKNQSFSYGAWVKAAGKTASASVLARMDELNGHRGWDLWQNGAAFSVHIIDNWPDNAIKVSTEQPLVDPNKWQHVFATYDGSGTAAGVRIYVDGKEQKLRVDTNTLKPDASIRSQAALRIGQRNTSAVFDGGAIQDVRIYDRLLSAAEVKTLVDIIPLRTMLAAKDRTAEQASALYDHYLNTRDAQFPALARAVTDLETEQNAIRQRSPITHIQEEKQDSVPMAHVLMRGEYDKPGEQVPAATPAALHPLPDGAPRNRMGLAQWLVDPANPLTARVTVNRFWQQVFGQGIVTTAEDFGVMGMLPSHPELLDWLAVDFVETGWDVKRFFRQMLMSSTYRQAAITTPDKLERDRGNAWLSRGPRFRMDAEMVRDGALASSGLLSSRMYGPGTKPYQPDRIWDMVGLPGGDTRNYVLDRGENLYRRTVYTFWKRMAPPPGLEAFNAPSREVCTVRRERTNTPLQALVTLNDPQYFEAARHLAENAMKVGSDENGVIAEIAARVLSRPLTTAELAVVNATRTDLLAHYESNPDDAKSVITVGESKPDERLNVIELATWTMVCNQIMNLDEALNK